MRYAGMSSVGKVRGNNEDFFHVPRDEHDVPLFVVADGMGGMNAGEIASALAVADVVTCVRRQNRRVTDKPLLLRKAVTQANTTVFKTARSDIHYVNMGTTLVCALLDGDRIHIANVGDSRCYLLSGPSFEQVSVDHSYVQEMLSQGLITPEEAKHHPNRNLITRAVGSERFVTADVFTRPFLPGDRLLLASDGLTGMIEPELLRQVLAEENDCEQAVRRLITLANDAGGRDNITAVVIYQA